MTTALDVAREPSTVNAMLAEALSGGVEALVEKASTGALARELEEGVWTLMLSVGRAMLGACMAAACKRATEADIEERGLQPGQATLRMDRDYWATQMSSMGPIHFPLFAYRERRGAITVTRTPARAEVVPMLGHCRSTELCLEWECRLGKDLPFRRAQDALRFFSHGAVREEDTTLAAHAVAIGSVVNREWLYRSLPEIRRILKQRATRDKKTKRPIVYLSQDAHAERRYVDETWKVAWKSLNGLRMWAIDRRTGATIHLGGEYTWGDCHEIGRIVGELIADGILPVDGDYGEGIRAELVVITDGLQWIEDYVLTRLPWAHTLLDLYHALKRLGDFAGECFGAGSKAAKKLYRRLARKLAPSRRRRSSESAPRKGHKKRAKVRPRRSRRKYGNIWDLLETLYLAEDDLVRNSSSEEFELLLHYFQNNAYRGDYDLFRARGYQIGSGAMESFHRTAAQLRLKLAGARWGKSTSLAIVNLRLLDLAERWDEFWRHDGLSDLLRTAFTPSKESLA